MKILSYDEYINQYFRIPTEEEIYLANQFHTNYICMVETYKKIFKSEYQLNLKGIQIEL